MRTKVGWRSASRDTYKDFRKKHPSIEIPFDEWKKVVYGFNESFRDYILETGEKIKLPLGYGQFSINKKKRQCYKTKDGIEYVNLAIDWVKSKQKGKRIYNFNYHTDGYFFGWKWFKETARIKYPNLWFFKASRTTCRLLSHYLKVDNKYQHMYNEWKS